MDKKELLDNIRADFFTEICPFFRASYLSDYEAVQTAINSVRLITTVLNRDFIYRCATIVEKNTIEFSLVNLYAKKEKRVTYEQRVNIRFISSFSASMFTAAVLKRSHNPFTVVVVPFINGMISVTFLLLTNPEETEQLMNRKYPQTVRFLEEKFYLKEIKKYVKQINDFINRPHQPIHSTNLQINFS